MQRLSSQIARPPGSPGPGPGRCRGRPGRALRPRPPARRAGGPAREHARRARSGEAAIEGRAEPARSPIPSASSRCSSDSRAAYSRPPRRRRSPGPAFAARPSRRSCGRGSSRRRSGPASTSSSASTTRSRTSGAACGRWSHKCEPAVPADRRQRRQRRRDHRATSRQAAAANPEITLIDNAEPPHGYTIAANLGLRAADGDYVVLLNSDTIVTFGWLERIVDCGESDERDRDPRPALQRRQPPVGAASCATRARWATNPLPAVADRGRDGRDASAHVSPRDAAAPAVHQRLLLRGQARRHRRDRLLRRGELRQRLLRGERLLLPRARGRLRARGRRRRATSSTPSRSRSRRGPQRRIAKRNYEIFLEKHGAREDRGAGPRAGGQTSRWRRCGPRSATRLSSPAALARRPRCGRRRPARVVFVLPGLGDGGSGGSHSIYQEVSGLRALGVPARIALAEQGLPARRAPTTTRTEVFVTFRRPRRAGDKTARRRRHLGHPLQVGGDARRSVRERARRLPPGLLRAGLRAVLHRAAARRTSREAIASYTRDPGLPAVRQDALALQRRRRRATACTSRRSSRASTSSSTGRATAARRRRRPCASPRWSGRALRAASRAARSPCSSVCSERYGDEVEVVTFGCDDERARRRSPTRPTLRGRPPRPADAPRGRRAAAAAPTSSSTCRCTRRSAAPRSRRWPAAAPPWCRASAASGSSSRTASTRIAVDTLTPTGAIEVVSDLARDRDRLWRLQAAALETAAALLDRPRGALRVPGVLRGARPPLRDRSRGCSSRCPA